MRIFTGKCSISQTGSGSGYIQVSITNFNDPGGQFDTTEIQVGDKVVFTDSGDIYKQDITEVVSASGATATVKVTNVGVSSIPTTTNAFVSRGSVNYSLFPFVANTSFNENQLFLEDTMAVIDDALDTIAGGGGGPTNLTLTGSGPITLNSSTGSDVTFTAGSGITLTRNVNDMTIAATGGGGGATNLTFSGTSSPFTLDSSTGTDVTFAQGNGITLSRSGNQLIVAANSTVTGVTDLINGLDITNNAGSITVAPNIPELTTVNTYDTNDQIMFWDNSASAHRKMNVGSYMATGFVDKVSTQTDIGGEKGFTTALHYGAASLPTGSAFGTSVDTVFALKGGLGDVTEANFQSFGGLVIKTVWDAGTNDNTTKIIATGSDSGNDSSKFKFYTRDNSISGNWVQALEMYNTPSSTIANFGGATASPSGNVNVPSLGFEGALSHYLMRAQNNNSQTFLVLENTGSLVAYLSAGQTGWQTPSDLRLKEDITELCVLDSIDNLKGVSYTLKSSGNRQIGVIAQDIETVFPEAVTTDEETDIKGVSYQAIASIALQGVKELKGENDYLKAKIEELLNRVEALENR